MSSLEDILNGSKSNKKILFIDSAVNKKFRN